MPQKACERGFCHVIAFSQFFEMPQNRRISFSVPFLFLNSSRVNFLKCPFFMFEFFEMPHFSYLILKMGKWGI